MTRDFHDPATNYTVSENLPGGLRIPEYVFRQLVSYGLRQVRDALGTADDVLPELFAMAGPEVTKQLREYLLVHPNFFIGVNWPTEDVHLPLVTIIDQGASEDGGMTLLGDQGGLETLGGVGVREHRVIPQRHSTNLYVATPSAALTLYLTNLVRFIIVSNKDALTEWHDIHNLVLNTQPVEFDQQQLPTFGYYRVIQLQYMTLWDYNVGPSVRRIVGIAGVDIYQQDPVRQPGLQVQTTQAGAVVVVPVPSDV